MEKLDAPRLNPLNAVMFSCLFKDMDSRLAMLELLNAILAEVGEEPIIKILDMKSEYSLITEGVGAKYGRVDVIVRTQSNRIFDIEVQIARDEMNNRDFFYGARLLSSEFKSGQKYSEMPKIRIINILDFLVREDNTDLVQTVSLNYDKEPRREATDVFKIYHIQMPIFRKEHKNFEEVKGNAFYTWLYLFDKGYKDKEEMSMIASISDGMKNFAQKYSIAINDPRLTRLYQMEQDAIRDENSRLDFAKREGKREGIREGKKEAAIAMKIEGVAWDIISRVTQLTLKEIASL